jgi:outer membrane protein
MTQPEGKRILFFQGISLLVLLLMICPASAQDLQLSPGQPLTLEQCTAIALKYQPSLRASAANIEASKAALEQTLANYYPQVNLNNSYATTTNNYSVGGTQGGTTVIGIPGQRNRYSWTFTDVTASAVTVSQNIYDFGRTANTAKISRENINVSQEDFSITRQTVILNVQQAYYTVLSNLRLVQVAEDTVNQNRQRLEQAQGFYQAGTRPKIDVTNAEVNMANAELALIVTRNNYQVSRYTLNNAMGLRQDLNFPIEDSLASKRREVTLEEILQKALDRRPEITQIRAKERAQEATIKLAESSYYPTLSGNASYTYRTADYNKDYYWDWFFGASLNFPLFSGFSTPAQIAQAKAALRNLQAQEESLKLSIRLEGQQAYLALMQADERIRVTEKQVGAAQENFELATGRYQVGVGFPLEVTDAEVSLANARAAHIQALSDYKIAEARIDKAMALTR